MWIALPIVLIALVGVGLAMASIALGFAFLAVLVAVAEAIVIPALFFVLRALADGEPASESPPVGYALQRQSPAPNARRPAPPSTPVPARHPLMGGEVRRAA